MSDSFPYSNTDLAGRKSAFTETSLAHQKQENIN